MATNTLVVTAPDTHMGPGRSLVATFPTNLNGDVTSSLTVLGFDAVSVAVSGTFGVGGSVTLEGSYDNVNFFGVQAAGSGSAIAITAAGIAFAVSAAYRYVRARVTAGDGTTSLAITLFLRTQSRY